MQIHLSPESTAKLEDILEQLEVQFQLEGLSPEELIDALLDLGTDLVLAEEPTRMLGRDRLLAYCGEKIGAK